MAQLYSLGVIATPSFMTPQEFEAMKDLETATLLAIAAERPNSRQQAALHILETRRQTELRLRDSQKESHKDSNGDRWYKKIVIGVVISVVGGLLLLAIKIYFGL